MDPGLPSSSFAMVGTAESFGSTSGDRVSRVHGHESGNDVGAFDFNDSIEGALEGEDVHGYIAGNIVGASDVGGAVVGDTELHDGSVSRRPSQGDSVAFRSGGGGCAPPK